MSAISDPITGMRNMAMVGMAPDGDGLSPGMAASPGTVDETDRRFQQLNEFLRDEISAELSYRMTADRLAGTRDAPYVGLLRQMEEEHGLAAETLRQCIRDDGGETDDACGSLGPWRPAARCSASLFGASESAGSALECLRAGELHNLESYAAFAAGTADRETGQLLRNLLIPIQQRHVRVLNELLGQRYGA